METFPDAGGALGDVGFSGAFVTNLEVVVGAVFTIGTLVAFTTLQARMFFPIQSLLSISVDVQSSLALFERVFDYLDEPVEIRERPGAANIRRARCAAR